MAREMSRAVDESGTLFRVVIERENVDGRESRVAYGPYATRGAAATQKAREAGPHSWYTPERGWETDAYIETTAVDWQREEEG
jgi:hypothetical protein